MAAADGAAPTGAQNREGRYIDESEDRELTPREEALRAIAARRMGTLAAEIVECVRSLTGTITETGARSRW